MNIKLVMIGGKMDGIDIPVSTPQFLIGRGDNCHYQPESKLVSRLHCLISTEDASVTIEDCGSALGTLVNNEKVHHLRHELKHGDRIKIGPLEFEVRLDLNEADKKKRQKSVQVGEYERSVMSPAMMPTATSSTIPAHGSVAVGSIAQHAKQTDLGNAKDMWKGEANAWDDSDKLLLSIIGMLLLIVLALWFGVTDWHWHPVRWYWTRITWHVSHAWMIGWVRWGTPVIMASALMLFLAIRARVQKGG